MFCTYSAEGGQVPQQEETGNGGVPGDDSVANNVDPSVASAGELVVSSSSSALSATAKNLVGMPTLYIGKVEEHHSNISVDEDSEERKRKAMDQLRKVSTCNCLLPLCSLCSNVCTKCLCLIL